MSKILILGGGFAAIAAAEVLAKEVGDRDEIVLVAKNEKFIFYPGLVPLVFGRFKPDEILFDLRSLMSDRGIRFVRGEVTEFDPKTRSVRISCGSAEEILDFDYVLIALGRQLVTEMIPGVVDHAHNFLGIGPALNLKQALSTFDSGSIVIGLCPDASLPIPVCEAALGFAQAFHKKIASGEVSIKAVFPSTLENALAGSGLFRDLEAEFERKGIELINDFPITRVHENTILSSFGSEINYDLLVLVPAFKGQEIIQSLKWFAGDHGFVRVNDKMQVTGFDGIYAAGDIVSLPGPRFGYMAIRQGRVAAENMIAGLRDREPPADYCHEIEWIIGERYTDPVFFHYGFWDDTLDDFDENAFFGMAKLIRERYGKIKRPPDKETRQAAAR